MEKQLLGIIDATTYHESMEELITERPLAALPFAGQYRLIDFILSSMVNSGIGSVAVFPKYQYKSLMDHLDTGRDWDLNRKRGGLFLYPPDALGGHHESLGMFDYFSAHINYLYKSQVKYTLVANCFTVANIDFQKIVMEHIASGCEITEIRHNSKSLEMYILETSLLIELIEKRHDTGYRNMREVANTLHHKYRLCYYHYTGYTKMIDSISKYYSTSIELLDHNVWKTLFVKNRPIYTKEMDEPPTRYSHGATIQNSLIANGCQIDGTVMNSIISKGVKIGKNSVIQNSIIFQDCQIEDYCNLSNVILDKNVKISSGSTINATEESPRVIRKGHNQGALMNL